MSLCICPVTNRTNGKRYIGKTKFEPPTRRWNQHLTAAKKGPKDKKRFQSYFHRALRKHRRNNFSFEVIATFDDSRIDGWMQAEKDYVKQYRSNERDRGHNLTDGGDGVLGWKASRAARRRMSNKVVFIDDQYVERAPKTWNASLACAPSISRLVKSSVTRSLAWTCSMRS